MLLYAVGPSFLVPGAVMTIAGGLAFGAMWGSVYSLIGGDIGAVVAFAAGRFLGKSFVERIVGERFHAMMQRIAKHGFQIILYLRFVPVIPYNALNLLAGASPITFYDYFWATMIGMVPGTILYAFLGDALWHPMSPKFFLALLLIARVGRMRRDLPPLDPRHNRRLARALQISAMESKHHRHEPVTLENASAAEMSTVERLKHSSEGLFYVHSTHESRHTMRSEIDALSARQAETISEHAKEISKHFGIYKQRERNESGKKDGDFIFMVRVKIPAGELTPAQWLALDAAADRYADGSLRLTARQGVQFHYVRGHNLSALIREINLRVSDDGYQLTTLGACGDVNRNTVASPIDDLDAELPLDSHQLAHAVAREMAPRSSAYYQVFLADQNGQQVAPLNSEEPIYGAQYLPRKFKVGFAHPHDNSVDLLTQDVGFLPRVEAAQGHRLRSLQRRRDGRDAQSARHDAAARALPRRRAARASAGDGARNRDDTARAWRAAQPARGAMEIHDSPPRRRGGQSDSARALWNRARRRRTASAAAGARSFRMASGSRRRRFPLRRNPHSERTSARRRDGSISQRDSAHRRRGRRESACASRPISI